MSTRIDSTQVLLFHDRWATDQLLDACLSLTDEQLDRPFEMGRGSLRKTIAHILNVIQGWQAAMEERGESPELPEHASAAQLREANERISASFREFAERSMSQETLHARKGERTLTAPAAAIVTHVLTHGTQHRAQALNMLRQLGVSPLPKSSVLEWMFATGVAH